MTTRPGSWVLRYSPSRLTTPTWPCCTMLTDDRSAASNTMTTRPTTTRPAMAAEFSARITMVLLRICRPSRRPTWVARDRKRPSTGHTISVVPWTPVTSTGVPAGIALPPPLVASQRSPASRTWPRWLPSPTTSRVRTSSPTSAPCTPRPSRPPVAAVEGRAHHGAHGHDADGGHHDGHRHLHRDGVGPDGGDHGGGEAAERAEQGEEPEMPQLGQQQDHSEDQPGDDHHSHLSFRPMLGPGVTRSIVGPSAHPRSATAASRQGWRDGRCAGGVRRRSLEAFRRGHRGRGLRPDGRAGPGLRAARARTAPARPPRLRVLMGLERASRGEVRLFGAPVTPE